MADGRRVDPRDDDAEQAALADEARLIRRVRWRLVAWSGLSTLVILVVLGAALYAAVAELARGGLGPAAREPRPAVRRRARRPDRRPGTGPQQGYVFGGGNTVLYIFDDKGAPVQVGERPAPVPDGRQLRVVSTRSTPPRTRPTCGPRHSSCPPSRP